MLLSRLILVRFEKCKKGSYSWEWPLFRNTPQNDLHVHVYVHTALKGLIPDKRLHSALFPSPVQPSMPTDLKEPKINR